MSTVEGPAIMADGVTKVYPGVAAVRGLNLAVNQGETFGFLGPNGAGKSTTVRMLCTLLTPTEGRIEIAGHDVSSSPQSVRREIGLVFQECTLDGDLTAAENLWFHGDLYGLPTTTLRRRVDEMLRLAGLEERRRSLARTLSGGLQRRLEIARSLLHWPRVLFLDEPTLGLDPRARSQLWSYLSSVRAQEGTTVFLTTHYLEEAEQCGRIAVIDGGRVVVEGRPAELKASLGCDRIDLCTDDDTTAMLVLRERFGVDPTVGPRGVVLHVRDGARLLPRLCTELKVPIREIALTPPSLDDVFLHHTGHAIGEPHTATGAGTDHLPSGLRR
jgi:ABC-2 type transport system ATP-binding protein